MFNADKKRGKSNPLYICEWKGCITTVFDDLLLYLQHVKRHSLNAAKELEPFPTIIPDCSVTPCGWTGCYENNFNTLPSYHLHVSFHAFHCKLMSWGDEALSELKQIIKPSSTSVECHRDPSERCVLPELPNDFVCAWEDCLTSFDDAEAYYRHVDTHAMDIAIPSLSKEVLKTTRFATCRWMTLNESATESGPCNQSFLSKSYLKNHLRSHSQEKTVACSTCGAMFSDKSKFRDHILRQLVPHESDNCFSCTFCHTNFLTQRLLNEHTRKHTKSIACKKCGKLCSNTSEYNKHYAFRHSGAKLFDCKFCDSRFKSKVDLRRHIYTHNEDNIFKCNVVNCSYESRCQQSLTRHQKKVHQGQELNLYECHECKARFTRGANLTKHLKREHAIQKSRSESRFKYINDPQTGVYHLST